MITRLKLRFVGIAMAAVFAVLFIIVLVINLLNYNDVVSDADVLTAQIEQRAGGFDRFFGEQQGDFPQPPQQGNNLPVRPDGNRVNETPFETRFFVVTITGDTVTTNTAQIAAVTEEEAVEMAKDVLSGDKTKGFKGVYRYRVDGDTVIFVDCTRQLGTARTFLIISLLVSAGALVAVFVLVMLFSGKVVKPFVESHERQKRFVTEASHELKTPLTIISANNELIEMEAGESDLTHAISKQVERMTTMVKNMTALARLDEMDTMGDCKTFDLSLAVEDVANSFSAALGEDFSKKIALGVEYVGNENLIRQLTSILLDNAVKYSKGGTALSLTEGKHPVLTVCNRSDDTDGDKSAYLERFGRGEIARAKVEGSGIGLALAREIVGLHRGKIDVYQSDGVFTVRVTL